MTSRDVFREFGDGPIVQRSATAIDWWWGLVAVLCMLAMLALTTMLDERSQRLHTAAGVEKRVREEMKQTVVAAYRQGRSDTLEAVGCASAEVRP